ncbi:MAG: hypothetical protein R2824_21595 [Saprospiraceae bacterium]|nr:hypothetical protein [Lewinella sp.]
MRKKGTLVLLLVGLCLAGKAQIPLSGQFHFEMDELRSHLANAPLLTNKASSLSQETSVQILLPTPKGNQITFSVWEDPILSDDLQAEYTDYHTYTLLTDEDAFSGRLLLSPAGLDAVVIGGEQVLFIEAVGPDESLHRVYYWQLGNNFLSFDLPRSAATPQPTAALRLAVLADEEYARFHQQDVMRAVLASVNGVNAFLQLELGLKVDLSYFETLDYQEMLKCRQEGFRGRTAESIKLFGDRIADGTLPMDTYDLGHLFSGRGFGGSSLANVAGSNTFYDWNEDGITDGPAKAGGGSGAVRPEGDNWWGHLCRGISRQIGRQGLALSVQRSAENQTGETGTELTAGLGNLEHFPATMKHYSGPGTRGEYDFPHLSCLPIRKTSGVGDGSNLLSYGSGLVFGAGLQSSFQGALFWPWLISMPDSTAMTWLLQGVKM